MTHKKYVVPEDWPGLNPEMEATIKAGSKEALKEKAVDLLNQFDPDTRYIYTLDNIHGACVHWRTEQVFGGTLHTTKKEETA